MRGSRRRRLRARSATAPVAYHSLQATSYRPFIIYILFTPIYHMDIFAEPVPPALICAPLDLLSALSSLSSSVLRSYPPAPRAVQARIELVSSLLGDIEQEWRTGACFERHLLRHSFRGRALQQAWVEGVVGGVRVARREAGRERVDWEAVGGALEQTERDVSLAAIA